MFHRKLFDSVTFSLGFINSIVDGHYPNKLLKFIFDYFISSGVSIILPHNLTSTEIETLRKFSGNRFIYYSSKLLNTEAFRMEMKLTKTMPKAPMLCHQKYELAFTNNMYSEIFKDMKFVLFRWQLNNDMVWFSDSFKEIYGVDRQQKI